MRINIAMAIVCFAACSAASAYDNGPQKIGCDYKLGAAEGTGQCSVAGSGMNQGISWVVFELKGKRFRYTSSSADRIELIDKAGKTLSSHAVRNADGPCRPGGKAADIYDFSNGDRVCLYWK